jgi:hypothetical protein
VADLLMRREKAIIGIADSIEERKNCKKKRISLVVQTMDKIN